MKKNKIFHFFELVALMICLVISIGHSAFVTDQIAYDSTPATVSNPVTTSGQCTITLKYEAINDIKKGDYIYPNDSESSPAGISKPPDVFGSRKSDNESLYTAIINFVSKNTTLSTESGGLISGESIAKGTHYMVGLNEYTGIDFCLNVTAKIERRGNLIKRYYGAYTLTYRYQKDYTFATNTLDSANTIVVSKGSSLTDSMVYDIVASPRTTICP